MQSWERPEARRQIHVSAHLISPTIIQVGNGLMLALSGPYRQSRKKNRGAQTLLIRCILNTDLERLVNAIPNRVFRVSNDAKHRCGVVGEKVYQI